MLHGLYIRDFRNIPEATLCFGPKANIFYGPNAQGKTNLLEAISLISTGRSFRTQNFQELIREGATHFFLKASFETEGIEQTVSIFFDGKTKRVEHNATSYGSFQPLLGLLPAIFFTPQDSDLIGGSPAIRRRFLDIHLAQSDPLYVHHFLRYSRALRQRNAQLRTKALEGIECWEQEMSLSASYLNKTRHFFLQEMNGLLGDSPLKKEPVEIRYSPSYHMQDYLQRNRYRDCQVGFTQVGPHRDDFILCLSGKAARPYASEGQKRCASATLRLAEWYRLKRQIAINPLFGIDDFELHLDPERQNLLQRSTEELGQLFITTPLEPKLLSEARYFYVELGHVIYTT